MIVLCVEMVDLLGIILYLAWRLALQGSTLRGYCYGDRYCTVFARV